MRELDTLIVWSEPTTQIDMALSFQESEGCATIWCVDLANEEGEVFAQLANCHVGDLSTTYSSKFMQLGVQASYNML